MSIHVPKKNVLVENKIINANLFKKNKQLEKNKCWDDIISQLVLTHKKTDDELKEIARICSKEDDVG